VSGTGGAPRAPQRDTTLRVDTSFAEALADPVPDPKRLAQQWGVLAQLAGKSWGFGNVGFASYQWVKPGETLVGTVRTLAGTYQTIYVLRADGTIAGLRKLTETGDSAAVAVVAAPDRFSAGNAGSRYACISRKNALICADEVSVDGKRWSVRSSLTGSEISEQQLRAIATAIPSGFPDWKPGTFDPRLGAFEKLSTQVWVAPASTRDHELRFQSARLDTGAVGVQIGDFDTAGNPTRYFGIYSDPAGPLKSVLNFWIDAKHPGWDVEPRPGVLSSTGDASIFVDGNLWHFSISPDQHFALLEKYNGTRQREDKLASRQVYHAVIVPESEQLRWRSVSHLFNNFYYRGDAYVAWRWLAPGKVLVTNYFQQSSDEPYAMSYCVLSLNDGETVSGSLPCIGQSSGGESRRYVLRDITDDGFTWSDVAFRGQKQPNGWRFQNAKGDKFYAPLGWIDTSAMKINYERGLAKDQAHEEYRQREHRQQAEMQALYNGLSLLANQTMAATGRTTTYFDASPGGVPAAPLRYDAGGVYGQATADGGYYVGNGISSKEVEAFQAKEALAGRGSNASAAPLAPSAFVTEADTPDRGATAASDARNNRSGGEDSPPSGPSASKKQTAPPAKDRPIHTAIQTTHSLYYFGITDVLSLENKWMPLGTFGGLSAFAMFRRELKDQIIAQLKIENHNRYSVVVGITPSYKCQGKPSHSATAMTLTLAPGETANGQNAGLYDYPCPGSVPPEAIGYELLSVKRVD